MQRLLALALAAGLTAGCAAAKALVPIRVDSPALRNLGYVPEGTPIVITNKTRSFPVCDVVAANKPLGPTVPGQTLTDVRNYQPFPIQIPVVALCYWDAAGTQYAGAAGAILQLHGYNHPAYWGFSDGDIRLLRGGSAVTPVVSRIDARKVRFPSYFLWNGAALVQIVNNRAHPGTVQVDGRPKGILATGDVFHLANYDLSNYVGRVRLLQVIYPDQAVTVSIEGVFYVPTQGVNAYQYIVSDR